MLPPSAVNWTWAGQLIYTQGRTTFWKRRLCMATFPARKRTLQSTEISGNPMASELREYLADVYKSRHSFSLPKKYLKTTPIQIDDQDDDDSIADFCNIFCIIRSGNALTLEFYGRFPITREMADLVEIYGGRIDSRAGKIALPLTIDQIEVLRDLSEKIRKTSFMGDMANNPSWLSMSARTISSLYRFIRIIKEYRKSL
jgi:hypothetical protein